MTTRHLHYSGDTHTVCGWGRSQRVSVHVTKARKTDCTECRDIVRDEIEKQRGGTRAREKAEEYLAQLRMGDTHSSDVDPGDPYR